MSELDLLWFELLHSPNSRVEISAPSTEDVVIKAYGMNGEFVGEIVEGVFKDESSESN